METIKHDVAVHKADIALASGESIGQYMRRLSDAGREHVMKKLNATPKTAYVYMCEAYGDAAVFDVSIRKDDTSPGVYKFYAVKYTRKDDGKFEFAETKEVTPVTTFQPVDSLNVAKAAPAEAFVHGWSEVAKSMWDGVL